MINVRETLKKKKSEKRKVIIELGSIVTITNCKQIVYKKKKITSIIII